MKITVAWLKAKHACPQALAICHAEWPDGAEITEAVLHRAVELQLNVDWLATWLLPTPILAEYMRQETTLWKEYTNRNVTLDGYPRHAVPLLWRMLQQAEEVLK